MVTIIAGSRTLSYKDVLEGVAHCPFPITKVITGGARGIDQCADLWAMNEKIPREVMNADWDMFGKAAGFRRNQDMANHPEAQACLLIWDGVSTGTTDMLKRAEKKGLRCFIHLVAPR